MEVLLWSFLPFGLKGNVVTSNMGNHELHSPQEAQTGRVFDLIFLACSQQGMRNGMAPFSPSPMVSFQAIPNSQHPDGVIPRLSQQQVSGCRKLQFGGAKGGHAAAAGARDSAIARVASREDMEPSVVWWGEF